MTGRLPISCTVNGVSVSGEAEPRLLLSDYIRHELELTGTHVGCEHGVCGACTILIDGRTSRSCLVFAAQADGCSLTTVEGLSADGALNVLQQAFHEHFALQCGFCTPGILMTATELLADNPSPSPDDVRAALSGHICRCTGYVPIVEAILAAAAALRAAGGQGRPAPQDMKRTA